MKLTKKQRAELRGMFDGRCAYCGNELGDRWHADHVEPVRRELRVVRDDQWRTRLVQTGALERPENDHIGNLMPSCAPCNIRKHAASLEDFRHGMQRALEVARAASSAYRHALRFGLLTEHPGPVVFHFEKVRAALAGVEHTQGVRK